MHVFLLVSSIILNLFGCGILRNEFCKKEIDTPADLHAFNAFSSLLSALTLLVVALVSGSLCVPSLFTLLMGVVFGIATALCAVLHMQALESGPLSYTNIITSCAMVIPSLSGVVLYGEPVSAGQYIGIALMLVSFICAVDAKNEKSGTSLKWLLLCLGSFLFSGSIGVMQKVHQSSAYKNELSVFLVIAFVISAAFSFLYMLCLRKKGGVTLLRADKVKKFVWISVVCGIALALVNQINMYLSGAMAAIVFYPVFNGSCMILTTAAGLVLWKEQLSRRQLIGLVLGGAAIVLLCGVF